MRSTLTKDIAALKTATRRLVEAAGGQTLAADVCGVAQSTVSRWADPHHPETTMPVSAVAALEAATGLAYVTEALAGLSGRDVVRHDHLPDIEHAVRISKESADVVTVWLHAQSDGNVTPRQAREVKREIGELVDALRQLAARCDAAEAGGA